MGSPLLALWRTRSIIWLLIRRELKVRYGSSKFGYVWTILDPLMTCLVFWLVFGIIFTRSEGTPEPYIVFLIAGYLPWMCISGAITGSARAISGEAKLVRSTSLPRELWLIRVVGAKCMELLFSIPVLVAFMIGFALVGEPVGISTGIVYLPLAIVLMIAPIIGIGLALAPLCVLYTDLARVVRIIVRLLFYMTPVLYPSTQVISALDGHDHLKWIEQVYFLNPFVAVIDLYRTALWSEQFPGWDHIGMSVGVSAVLLVVGTLIFRRVEGSVLKEI